MCCYRKVIKIRLVSVKRLHLAPHHTTSAVDYYLGFSFLRLTHTFGSSKFPISDEYKCIHHIPKALLSILNGKFRSASP